MDQSNPFRLQHLPASIASVLEWALSLTPLAKTYDQRPKGASPEAFLDYAIDALGCTVSLNGQPLHGEIPERGPTIVVANHPFGGIEGMILTRALLAIRADTRVLANHIFLQIPELAPVFFGVDVLNNKAIQRNVSSMKQASKHLANDGVLLVFPAGKVSSLSCRSHQVTDSQWTPMIGRLVKKYNATCVPVFIHGKNPFYFHIAGLLNWRLRTALLPRQLTNKKGQTIKMTVGKTIQSREIAELESASAITNTLRLSTYLLANHSARKSPLSTKLPECLTQTRPENIEQSLEELADCKLFSKAEFDVYCAPYYRLNALADLLATERETTFRAAGEGTGKEKDVDQFDPIYQHLFVWDREKKAIVGGYRLGKVDEIVKQHGIKALYSRSLYRYNEKYLELLGPALEVGRSFVTQPYQRHPASLDLLWRGIGRFLVQHPHYRVLFGCVSISSDHSESARAFISDAMMESFRAEQKFLENVTPIAPLKVKDKVWSTQMLYSIKNISVFNKLVGQCDPGKSIPILLRHYLALNGRFVGFSVNKGFNDSLDGLILMDVRNAPKRYLTRYLGKEGLVRYMSYWSQKQSNTQDEHTAV